MSKPNESSNPTASGGIGFWGLLQIVFITLKLLNVIEWSWWWVLLKSPLDCKEIKPVNPKGNQP